MNKWKPEDIEKFRKSKKLTRRALGELTGVTVTTIYQWERGLRKPSKTARLLLTRIEKEFKERV